MRQVGSVSKNMWRAISKFPNSEKKNKGKHIPSSNNNNTNIQVNKIQSVLTHIEELTHLLEKRNKQGNLHHKTSNTRNIRTNVGSTTHRKVRGNGRYRNYSLQNSMLAKETIIRDKNIVSTELILSVITTI